jgi:nucleoside-diphosphate-sugar epimerase
MHILITGASGFIGQELATALLEKDQSTRLTLTDIVEPARPANASMDYQNIEIFKHDLTSPETVEFLFSARYNAVYLLHGVMSGGSEADLELGLKVNIDSFRSMLDCVRVRHPGTKVIFPSSLAVYGPRAEGEIVNETTCPLPQSSYGAEKLIIETLINDYSRRGLLDGRIARLPTVIVRPGQPSAAASSFASGIVRESLKGEKNVLPVEEDLDMWICSPQVVVQNLIMLKDSPKEQLGIHRVVCLPGQTVKVGEILDALETVGGKEKRALVEKKKDSLNENIVKR